ncbi:MAG: TolC family protein [Armatimonadia bacterium]
MRIGSWLSGALLVMVCGSLLAAGEVSVLTEQAVVEQALAQHPFLQMARAEAAMAGSRTDMARSEARAQVSVNGYAGLSNMGNNLPIPGVMPQAILQSQDRASLDLNATAMLPISTGGRIESAIRAVELAASAAEDALAATRVEVAYEARAAYADWRAALAMEKVAQDALVAQQKQLMLSQHLFDVGKIPKFDLLRTEATEAGVQQQLANARAEISVATARLLQAMGASNITLGVPAEEGLLGPPVDVLPTALASRPDLLAARKQVAAAKATVQARQASYKPQWYGMAMLDGLVPSSMDTSVGITAGIVVGLPVVDGGRRQAEVREADQSLARAAAAVAALEQQVRAEVITAEARAGAARQNLETAASQVRAAEEAYRVAQVRYEAGKSIILEVLDALRAQTEAQQSLVVARAQYAKALADIYRATGLVGPPRG